MPFKTFFNEAAMLLLVLIAGWTIGGMPLVMMQVGGFSGIMVLVLCKVWDFEAHHVWWSAVMLGLAYATGGCASILVIGAYDSSLLRQGVKQL